MKEIYDMDTAHDDLGVTAANKFDAALTSFLAMHENAKKEMKYVENIFWG